MLLVPETQMGLSWCVYFLLLFLKVPLRCMTIRADLSELYGTLIFPVKSVVTSTPCERIPSPTNEDASSKLGSSHLTCSTDCDDDHCSHEDHLHELEAHIVRKLEQKEHSTSISHSGEKLWRNKSAEEKL